MAKYLSTCSLLMILYGSLFISCGSEKNPSKKIKESENYSSEMGLPPPKSPQEIIKTGNVEMFRNSLISGIVDIEKKDDTEWTLLHYATWYNKAEIAKLLVEYRADVNARDIHDNTPLHWAIKMGNEGVVLVLLADSKVDKEATDQNGFTPLQVSAWGCNEGIARILVNVGVDLDVQENKKGRTALHWAVQFNHIEMVELLLKAGANKEIKDKDGNCPLQLAIDLNKNGSYDEIIKLLRSK